MGRLVRTFLAGAVLSASAATLHANEELLAGLFPSGPPAPTMKRLDQIDPRRCISQLPHVITEPGNYQLCGDLSGSEGITISAPDVKLDLAGYTLSGTPGSGTGILILDGADNAHVFSGGITSWGDANCTVLAGSGTRLEDLRVSGSGGHGMALTDGQVVSCLVEDNTGTGILIDGPGEELETARVLVRDTISRNNGGHGIHKQPGRTRHALVEISHGATTGNLGDGILLEANGPCSLTGKVDGSTSQKNGGDGIRVKDSSTAPPVPGDPPSSSVEVRDTDASKNEGNGISSEDEDGETDCWKSRTKGNGGNGISLNVGGGGIKRLEGMAISANGLGGVLLTVNDSAGAGGEVDAEQISILDCQIANNGGHGITILTAPGVPVDKQAGGGANGVVKVEGSTVTGSQGTGLFSASPLDLKLLESEFGHNLEEGVRAHFGNAASEAAGSLTAHAVALRGNGAGGLRFDSFGPPSLELLQHELTHLLQCQIEGNGGPGLELDGLTEAEVVSSIFRDNDGAGVVIRNSVAGISWDQPRRVRLEGCVLSGNAGPGLYAGGLNMNGPLEISLDRCDVANSPGHGIHVAPEGDIGPVSLSVADSRVSNSGENGLHVELFDPGSLPYDGWIDVRASSFLRNDGHGISIVACDGMESIALNLRGVQAIGSGGDGLRVGLCDPGIDPYTWPPPGFSTAIEGGNYTHNSGHGISLGASTTGWIRHALLSGNGAGGILLETTGMEIAGNNVSHHKGDEGETAGIAVHGPGNRIHGNTISNNDRGVALFANGNPVHGGSMHGNDMAVWEDAGSGVVGNSAALVPIAGAENPFDIVAH